MKQKVIFSCLVCGLATFMACGNGNNTQRATVFHHRALISNLTSSRIDVADTTRDLLVTAFSGDLPGRLLVSQDKKYTVAVSPIDFSVNLLDNSRQGSLGSANLTGQSEGVVITVDDKLILGAVPTESAPPGQAPGAVDVITATFGGSGTSITATLARQPSIYLPGARFLAASPNTNSVVAMADTAPNPANPSGRGRVWILSAGLVNGNTQAYQEAVSAVWDHPVFAIGSSDNASAYVFNCGPECGGSQASIVQVTFPTSPNVPPIVGTPLPIPSGATTGFMNGNMLYVAGSDPSDVIRVCPSANAIPLPCGALTPVDLTALTAGAPVAIAGGYHDRMALGSGNLLFVGSRGCNFTTLQGCLTLFDTVKATATVAPSAVFLPPNPGPGNDDVTGIAPVANNSGLSNQVYVIEAGELVIYDTLTQKVKLLDTPSPNVTGQAVDVVAVDN